MRILPAGLVAAVAVSSCTAHAAPPAKCANGIEPSSHLDMLVVLASKYGELPDSIGASSDSTVAEMIVNPETRTWTFIVSWPSPGPDGATTCIIAAGKGWERNAPRAGDPS